MGRRRGVVVLLALAVGLVLAVGVAAVARPLTYLGLATPPEPQLQTAVRALFTGSHGGDSVVLADATDFAWERVGICGPYHPPEDIHRRMAARVPRGATNTLQAFEGYCLLVFASGNRAVAWTTVERGVADCRDASGRVLTPGQARFRGSSLTPVGPAGSR